MPATAPSSVQLVTTRTSELCRLDNGHLGRCYDHEWGPFWVGVLIATAVAVIAAVVTAVWTERRR